MCLKFVVERANESLTEQEISRGFMYEFSGKRNDWLIAGKRRGQIVADRANGQLRIIPLRSGMFHLPNVKILWGDTFEDAHATLDVDNQALQVRHISSPVVSHAPMTIRVLSNTCPCLLFSIPYIRLLRWLCSPTILLPYKRQSCLHFSLSSSFRSEYCLQDLAALPVDAAQVKSPPRQGSKYQYLLKICLLTTI